MLLIGCDVFRQAKFISVPIWPGANKDRAWLYSAFGAMTCTHCVRPLFTGYARFALKPFRLNNFQSGTHIRYFCSMQTKHIRFWLLV